MSIREFQELIGRIYGAKDAARGAAWSYSWLVEEIGELGAALRNWDAVQRTGRPESAKVAGPQAARDNLREEFADVFAWLVSLAEMSGVDLADVASERYGDGCPYCRNEPCACQPRSGGEP